MAEFKPVTSMAELLELDAGRVVAGYRSGLAGDPAPGTDKCRGFHHGYRNGQVDGGFAEEGTAMMALARDYHPAASATKH